MPPEQGRDPRRVDARGDLYSLGCTLYFLLTGKKPFEGPQYDTLPAKLIAHAADRCPPAADLRPGLPKGVTTLLDRLMAKAPGDRPASAADVADALASLAGGYDLSRLFADAAPFDPPTAAWPN